MSHWDDRHPILGILVFFGIWILIGLIFMLMDQATGYERDPVDCRVMPDLTEQCR